MGRSGISGKRLRQFLRHGLLLRWFLNVELFLALVSLGIAAGFVASFASHYYYTVNHTVENQEDITPVDGRNITESEAHFIKNSGEDGSNFAAAAAEFAQNYPKGKRVELQVIDAQGAVVASSSGLWNEDQEDVLEHQAFLASTESSRTWRGAFHGEKIVAYTVRLNLPFSDRCALRYMISLEDVDAQIFRLAVVSGLVWLLFLTALLGSCLLYFRSILYPMGKMSETVSLIAKGNYDRRLEIPKHKDELTTLCADINQMAQSIESAEQMKLDFISTISHELRTPLTAIRGWGETLLQGDRSDAALVSRGLDIIVEESGRLTHLVEELLDFSRLQSSRMEFSMERMDVLAELEDVVFFAQERADREGITLSYTSSDLPAPMRGDTARLRQVFVNLMDNAFKYTPQGGSITVLCAFEPSPLPTQDTLTASAAQPSASKPPEELHVSFIDSGCGVLPEELPHITEKFFKGSAAVKGSGIGLAIVAEILKKHGCALSFESGEGEGLTVRITFPLLHSPE
ncbi:MAG: HAMP domain-containing histidine kinase [Oscillospiraceae bacterium]|jgi:signal transduction histidine kinase|nr:HAMP domain-containing histidine kinase [Oscillospiraceae bacterium]